MLEAPIRIPDPSDPATTLASVVSLRRLADRLELVGAQAAIDQGWSWTDVADALGVSRQAAHKKLARRVKRRAPDSPRRLRDQPTTPLGR